jgi:hypothetical protein
VIDAEQVRQEAGPCPACGAIAAKPMIWGYPSAEDFEELGDTVGWGGCCLPPMPAAYVCDMCGEEYGVLGQQHNPHDL